jgi:hypothetical protein
MLYGLDDCHGIKGGTKFFNEQGASAIGSLNFINF